MSTLQAIPEFASAGEIRQGQLYGLQKLLGYCARHSPYYRRVFDEHGFEPEMLGSIDDLTRLPFTTKEQFASSNRDFISVPRSEVADYVTTSGTLGEPVSYAISRSDLHRLATNEARSMACAGFRPGETVMLMTTLDKCFMAGLAYQLGVRELGCALIRTGPGVPAMQWDAIRRFNPDHIIAVPSFLPRLIGYARDHGITFNETSVRSIMCIGEPIRDNTFKLNSLGRRITEEWDVKLYSTYASTEMAAAFTECEAGQGGHLRPSLIHLEVLDENDRQVSSGEAGEVVITTLGVEGTPLIRYRTGDICTYHSESCSCGRHSSRLGPVIGRKQQMLKFKGTTIYPPQVFDLMDRFEQVSDYILQVSSDEFGSDLVEVLVPGEIEHTHVAEEITRAFKSELRVTPDLLFLDSEELVKLRFSEGSRKPLKFIDKR